MYDSLSVLDPVVKLLYVTPEKVGFALQCPDLVLKVSVRTSL